MIDKKYLDILNIKPFSYEKKGSVIIVNKKYVFKKNKKDLKELFKYLSSREFNNYEELLYSDKDINVFLYEEKERDIDIIDIVSKLHLKTCKSIDCDISFYEDIYTSIKEELEDIEKYYLDLNEQIENEIYMSPSNYLLIRNISKVYNNINYIKESIETWYNLVKNKTKKKVSIIHNNLNDDHIINNKLISWDKYDEDLPIKDIVMLYKNVYDKYPFNDIFDKYLSKYKLSDDEMLLFFILISIPTKIEYTDDEYINVERVNQMINYMYKTDNFLSEYYSNDEKEE